MLDQDFSRHRKTGWSFFIYDLRETAQEMSLFNYSLASTYMKIYLRLFFFLNSNHANVLHSSPSRDATPSSVLARWRCIILSIHCLQYKEKSKNINYGREWGRFKIFFLSQLDVFTEHKSKAKSIRCKLNKKHRQISIQNLSLVFIFPLEEFFSFLALGICARGFMETIQTTPSRKTNNLILEIYSAKS